MAKKKVQALVIVGSPSDVEVMNRCAEVLDEFAQIEDEAANQFPKRDRGNACARRVTGELMKLCRVMFGKSLLGVVATISSILLESEISESTIRGWHPRG